jgi:UDP-N-acetylmuramoyl-L-alanyl-D-glutamate--2,6-diaminopimelate ligase
VSDVAVRDLLGTLRLAGILQEQGEKIPETVTAVADDSRAVIPGALFIAVPGTHGDGHEFLDDAARRGAAVAVVERAGVWPLPTVRVSDARRAAAIVAAVAYGNPARSLRLVGVTGTNGKTTTIDLARGVLDRTVGRCASLGTLGVLAGSEARPVPGGAGLTTPGAVELQRVLRALVDDGIECVAMEVSSHSLAQRRVDALSFDVAAFTTFTRDHLDYHGSMDEYFRAKGRLAEQLARDGVAVVNRDDPAWKRLPVRERVVTYSVSGQADVMAESLRPGPRGTEFLLRIGPATAPVRLSLIGEINVGNALAGAAVAYAMGARPDAIAAALSRARQVPGRLEVIAESPLVLRDYAHTPDALERALLAARRLTDGRLIAVFGCGGDRDRGKRPLMGEAAARLADLAVVTSDNPRTEDPGTIIDEIVAGMPRDRYERITDRQEAIARALSIAAAGDVVLLAGKGHETYQIRGTTAYPFDEREIVNDLLAVRS